MGAEPAAGDAKPGDGKPGEAKKEGSAFTKKMVKIVTVMAYMAGVSGAGFLLALYYIIFWDPNIQGVRPPGYLRSGKLVGLPQARTAPMPQALFANAPAGYHKKMSREFMEAYFNNLSAAQGDGQMGADSRMMEDSQPTPRVLPLAPETNYETAHQTHYNGQTTHFNKNHQSPGSSPQQQGIPRDTSPTGSPFVSDDVRRQQEHGQPPLSSSA